MTLPVLTLDNLVVEIRTRHGVLKPVNQVSYSIMPGEVLGVVGESGAGKSMAGNAVIGLLDKPARIADGSVHFKGRRIDNLAPDDMRALRGKEVGMVFQDPLTSLNPLIPIGGQLVETIRAHLNVSASEARERAIHALDEVGIPGAAARIDSYPHEFSGGMRQRVVIALALCAEPSLIIADEPTTALDVSVQAQIMHLLKRLCRERGTAVMLITHDMAVIAETAHRVAVMYAGSLVEIGSVEQVLSRPRHPYSKGLMDATPIANLGQKRMRQIPGFMPNLGNLPAGCTFHPRCEHAQENCKAGAPPKVDSVRAGTACWFPLDVAQVDP